MNQERPAGTYRAFICAALVFAAAVLGAGSAFAQGKKAPPPKLDAARMLNIAIRQPMLVERITKVHALIAQKVLESRAGRQLDNATAEFESALKVLLARAPTADIKANYELLEQLWEEYQSLASEAADPEKNKQLAEQNEEVVWIAQKGAMMLAEYSRSQRSDLITTAGDVRTLTQRIAKLYLFRSGGIRSKVISEDLRKAELEYRANMERLLRAPQNSVQIMSELSLAETQYIFLKQAIDRLNQDRLSKTELEYVAKACDNILEVMDRVTRLYESTKA